MAGNINQRPSKGFQPDSDVHITFEDQQKINKFAKHNARLEDYKIELDLNKNILQNLEDGSEELELCDSDEVVPFLFGEIFIWNNLSVTQELLEAEKKKTKQEMNEIELKCQELTKVMAELKAQLYSRFGSNISLEND
ncbi:probable prefoldin subunit 4 [Condylostylus longicornis]|uniref:probable prefoldin subunit 4 n=1 Tax=Condylostylus longicornis TaxID=2530218 RepID=UPI00244DC838|nr:probable prefoldin subunit 4 [Condylostylus longicornis]